MVNSSGHSESYDGVNVKPSSIQPVTPPIIIFTGSPVATKVQRSNTRHPIRRADLSTHASIDRP